LSASGCGGRQSFADLEGDLDIPPDASVTVPQPIEITLTPKGRQTHQHVCIEINVKNKSDNMVAWDRLFCLGLLWTMKAGGKNIGVMSREIEKGGLKGRVDRAKAIASILPGESWGAEFVLTKPFRSYRIEHEAKSDGMVKRVSGMHEVMQWFE